MGILTHMVSDVDEDAQVQRIFAITNTRVSSRSSLNALAGRAAVSTGAGQRTLVAAAYDELDIDMVWRDGMFSTSAPEEKWPDAQEIRYERVDIERASELFDILEVPKTRENVPGAKLMDLVLEGLDVIQPRERELHVWEIPFDVGGRQF